MQKTIIENYERLSQVSSGLFPILKYEEKELLRKMKCCPNLARAYFLPWKTIIENNKIQSQVIKGLFSFV